MPQFIVAFDQVLLRDAYSPDGDPVYLFMRAAVYDPSDPNTALWSASVGGLSPYDANVPADPGTTSPSGLYFGGALPVGQPVRHDIPDVGGPSFGLSPLPVGPGQRLRLDISLAPEVFFANVKDPPSDFDKALISGFTSLWGGTVGDLAGRGAVWVLSGGGDDDVQVPCYNPIILAEQDWSVDELHQLAQSPPQRFEFVDPQPGYGCPRASASYWLAFEQVPEFIEPTACLLLWQDEAAPRAFVGDWGDFGLIPSDQIDAWITRGSAPDLYNVRYREMQTATRDASTGNFTDVRVTYEDSRQFFTRNWYEFEPFGYRPVEPIAADCGSFSDVDHTPHWHDRLVELANIHELLAGFQSGESARGGRADVAAETAGERRSQLADVTEAAGVADLGGADKVRSGSIPNRRGFTRYLPGERAHLDTFTVPVLRLDPNVVMMLYGEYRGDTLLATRIRYLRNSGAGQTRTDVMLRPTYDPPR